MSMKAIEDQVKAEHPEYDYEWVKDVARGHYKSVMDKYCVFRHRGGTWSEIYHNTVDFLTDTGVTFEMAKIVVGYVAADRK